MTKILMFATSERGGAKVNSALEHLLPSSCPRNIGYKEEVGCLILDNDPQPVRGRYIGLGKVRLGGFDQS